ncbi:Cytochrome d ubiquinol oxidase subunit II [Snodgrassella alvi wkB2]|uniref:Cytochrome d ubiquinol oxidase subunit II n=1 Tax=Snodgrassella alvi TaxID=1196083 RepID=A0ABD7Z486_9NEIS|nr:cytochrome d ubiquinol oxidase subunit II [Snodgrassella alvi]AHN28036.1 Cytochrome d ubiquinol oxidase subunit II [Snodgrassella alvi wkB2]PIT46393.1 cytochrome d ubiquinol oxidase subunit II [Snodgrassella alvi]UOO98817.1 cytochrome d ubiquinol oxidase subunit II [Snodgrassella alvi wkB2]WLS99322.1 cytochrome d ubiquinol oxidase subunit II [Snodgrassella alvi]
MEFLDYSVLKFIWWLLLGVLLIGFAIMDGQDMGAGCLLPFVGRNDNERRVIINSIAPHWDGNQVWFLTGGGAIFAAWPYAYATAFSGFYWAMMAVLWAMFFRPVGFDYRSKINNARWRTTWDWLLFVGSFVPPLIFGVAFGNLLLGVPFHFDDDLRSFYTGSFWALLNPFSLLCGVVSAAMITFHGAIYLALRTDEQVRQRALRASTIALIVVVIAFSLAGIWVNMGINGYSMVEGSYLPGASPDPLNKQVVSATGAWMNNYQQYPLLLVIPVLAYVGFIVAWLLAKGGKNFVAFWFSALGLGGVISTAGVSMFPFIMPSNTDLRSSLTVWDASSSEFTLKVMLVVALIFVPLMLCYTSWCYRVMRGKVTTDMIRKNDHSLY